MNGSSNVVSKKGIIDDDKYYFRTHIIQMEPINYISDCTIMMKILHDDEATIVIQVMIRGYLQRPKYNQALKEKKEEAKLENQLRSLQK